MSPGTLFTVAFGINNSGSITILWGDSSGNTEGALYKGKKYTPINVPGAVSSDPHQIDTAGDIVYSWPDSSGNVHGAFCTNCTSNSRKYYKFDDPREVLAPTALMTVTLSSGGFYPRETKPTKVSRRTISLVGSSSRCFYIAGAYALALCTYGTEKDIER
jgi:hypothetical protein